MTTMTTKFYSTPSCEAIKVYSMKRKIALHDDGTVAGSTGDDDLDELLGRARRHQDVAEAIVRQIRKIAALRGINFAQAMTIFRSDPDSAAILANYSEQTTGRARVAAAPRHYAAAENERRDDPAAEIDRKIRARMAQDSALSYFEAARAVLAQNPDLSRRYAAFTGGRK